MAEDAVVTMKARTGIRGLDQVLGGGLPHGRATLVEGGPGAGKTVLALQTLVNGLRDQGERGVFVAFEEDPARIAGHASGFGWELGDNESGIAILDVRPALEMAQSGTFDLEGLLAALDATVREIGATRVVIDALDVALNLLPDRSSVRREVYRLHEWLSQHELTAIVTTKSGLDGAPVGHEDLSFVHFMFDCSIVMRQGVVDGVSQRSLRVVKYRGSGFEENETPFVIGPGGLEVAGHLRYRDSLGAASRERVSTGVERLDTMLGGGYYRGSSVLLTGSPGTAKTTLCGAFAAAACARGEQTLFVSFDSWTGELIRNLASVLIDLQPFATQGILSLVSARGLSASAEVHLMRLQRMAEAAGARCMVIDPLSALAKSGNEGTAPSVVERLIDWAKDLGRDADVHELT